MTLAGPYTRLRCCCRRTQDVYIQGALFVSCRAEPHIILPPNIHSPRSVKHLEAMFPVIYSYTLRLLLELLSTIGVYITPTCFFYLRLLLHGPPHIPHSLQPAVFQLRHQCSSWALCYLLCLSPPPQALFFKCFLLVPALNLTPTLPNPTFLLFNNFTVRFTIRIGCCVFLLFARLQYSLNNRITCNKGQKP